MANYMTSRFWKSTLGASPKKDGDRAERQNLSAAFDGMRDRAKAIAGGIRGDLPGFTVHDVTHLDALWQLAEEIAGVGVALTPDRGGSSSAGRSGRNDLGGWHSALTRKGWKTSRRKPPGRTP